MSTRIYILESTQAVTDRPLHSASKKLVNLIVEARKAVWKGKRLVQLTTKESWATVKLYFKKVLTAPACIPVLRPYNPLEHFGMQLQYPTPDRTSFAKQHFIEIWGSNLRKQQALANV